MGISKSKMGFTIFGPDETRRSQKLYKRAQELADGIMQNQKYMRYILIRLLLPALMYESDIIPFTEEIVTGVHTEEMLDEFFRTHP